MRFGGPRHGYGVAIVLEAVAGLVFDGSSGRLQAHSRFEAAALDHEAVDDAVKHRVVVEAAVDVVDEIFDRFGSVVGIELERNAAHARFESYDRISRTCSRAR